MENYSLDNVVQRANDLIEEYEPLRRKQRKLDQMSRLEWNLPEGMPSWARPFRTTIPYDAVRAGVRVLTGLDEDITIDPYALTETAIQDWLGAKEKANKWETVLKWQMDRAQGRRAILRQDVIRSALMYDEIVGQVVHLPTQIKQIEKLGGNANRQKAAMRHGQFAILLRNPQQVYTSYSDYMLEEVLYACVKRPRDIARFWNNEKLWQLINDDEAPDEWILFDYVNYDRRVVFCYPGNSINAMLRGKVGEDDDEYPPEAIELWNDAWEMEFLPWACVVGGTALTQNPAHSRFPLLYGILESDQWNNTNIMGTLMLSEAIAEAARPDVARKGITPDSVQARYGQPGGSWDVPAGHEIVDMQQKVLDPALREAVDRQMSDMNRSTIPSVLVTAEMAPNEPFAGFNLRIQQAMGSLMPFKILGERWFADAYKLMLYWAKESETDMTAYVEDEENELVEEYVIPAADIQPSRIYLDVELQADVPIDRQQRMAAAVQASQALKIPTADILEMLGETDPERTIKEWMMEQFEMVYLQGVLQNIQMEAQQAIQMAIQQAQQQAVMQIQQQAMQAMGAQGEGGPGQPNMNPQVQKGIPGVGGPGYNPAQGGTPPAQAAPGATREFQSGRSKAGGEIAF